MNIGAQQNPSKTKKEIIRNIFINKPVAGDNKKQILEGVLLQLPELAKHQSFFSKNFGFSIPKSLQITACKLASIFKIDLTEHNLAYILRILCSPTANAEECRTKLEQLTTPSPSFNLDQKNQSQHSNSDINHIIKVTNFILNCTATDHFSDIIYETNSGIYKDSHYTNYKTNNLFNNDVELSNQNHFKWQSTKTHVASGVGALSSSGEKYKRDNYQYGILLAMEKLQEVLKGKILTIKICDKKPETINQDDEATAETQLRNNIAGLYPIDGMSRKEAIKFYTNPKLKLEFTVSKVDGHPYTDKHTYIIKPVLLYDKENDHYFVHWEFGNKNAFDREKPEYMFHFNGNNGTSAAMFKDGAHLTISTDTVQVLIDYANKGVNHLLNPHLAAYKTSIKGSINPHLAAYNHYAKHNNNFTLEMYAYSYGNLAGAQFIKQIQTEYPDRKILFIGVGTATNLADVAASFVGKLGKFADQINMLNRSDIFEVLTNNKKVTAIIFNNIHDPVIKQSAQIQQHSTFKQNYQKSYFHCGYRNLVSVEEVTHSNITVVPFEDNKHGHQTFFGKLVKMADENTLLFDTYFPDRYRKIKHHAWDLIASTVV